MGPPDAYWVLDTHKLHWFISFLINCINDVQCLMFRDLFQDPSEKILEKQSYCWIKPPFSVAEKLPQFSEYRRQLFSWMQQQSGAQQPQIGSFNKILVTCVLYSIVF